MNRVRLVAALVFVPALVVWTWKLLEPNPVPEPVLKFLSVWDFLPYLAAKTLHASGYAFLTVLAWVAVPSRWRWVAVGFLLLHGAGSELLQHVLPFNRTGKLTDVMIDWLGIAVGVLVARRFLGPMFGAVTQDELSLSPRWGGRSPIAGFPSGTDDRSYCHGPTCYFFGTSFGSSSAHFASAFSRVCSSGNE